MSEYTDVFTDDPGRTNLVKHGIKLLSKEHIRSKGYPLPFKRTDTLDKEIEEMLNLRVIEPSISPYSSPILLIPKKNNSVRFCWD